MSYRNSFHSVSGDDNKPSITIVEAHGSRIFRSTSASPSSFSNGGGGRNSIFGQNNPFAANNNNNNIQPGQGDAIEPNNYIPLKECNPFVCFVDLAFGSAPLLSSSPFHVSNNNNNRPFRVLPDKISLTAIVSRDQLLYDLHVNFHNPYRSETSACLLSIPRLPGLLFMEESHTCGDVNYIPNVEEKHQAEQKFETAANSTNQTASISEVSSDAHHIRIDKVPGGASGTFRVRFLQIGGLKTRQAVLPNGGGGDGGEEGAAPGRISKQYISDLAILPGYVGLGTSTQAPEFELTVTIGEGLKIELPTEDVLLEDLKSITSNRDILSVVQLTPSLVSENGTLKWSSLTGLARGTLIKARIVDNISDGALTQMEEQLPFSKNLVTNAVSTPVSSPLQPFGNDSPHFLSSVDTMERISYETTTGIQCDSTMLDVNVPLSLPDSLRGDPSTNQHEIYIIVDCSGSTGMRTSNSKTFLDTSKEMLGWVLQSLQERIQQLRSNKMMNGSPVKVRLWSFDNDTRVESESTIPAHSDFLGGDLNNHNINSSLMQMQFIVSGFQSGGMTNYDSWANLLRQYVSNDPINHHHVLLVTDGGATRRKQFFDVIRNISATVSTQSCGSFQVDSLGYGPWLDPGCVSFLSEITGGEAFMVDSLEGEGTRKKVLSLLTRSLLRAASPRLTITVEGAKVLAFAPVNGDGGDFPLKSKHDTLSSSGTVYEIDVIPGQTVRLLILHPSISNALPKIALCCLGNASGSTTRKQKILSWPSTGSSGNDISSSGDGWYSVEREDKNSNASTKKANESGANGNADDDSCHASLVKKLSNPDTRHALHHLSLLEPAFAGSHPVTLPPYAELDRKIVTLNTSIRGQIVAPSVTKSIALADLKIPLAPVPEECRPRPMSFQSNYQTHIIFEDETTQFGNGGFGSSAGWSSFGAPAPSTGSLGFGAPAPIPFGAPAPTPFGAPAPTPFGAPTPSPFGAPAPSPFGSPAPAPSLFGSPAPFGTSTPSPSSLFGAPTSSPFASTRLVSDELPSFLAWVSKSRGGLFPIEAETFGKKRLTKNTIFPFLQSQLHHVSLNPSNRPFNSDPSSEYFLAKRTLHLVDCVITLCPDDTGAPGLFQNWASSLSFENDARALVSALVCAAATCGVRLTSDPRPPHQSNWPWLGPPSAVQHKAPEKVTKATAQVHCDSSSSESLVSYAAGTVLAGEEFLARKQEAQLFTSAVRRDIYKILRNPDHPQLGAPVPLQKTTETFSNPSSANNVTSIFKAALVAKISDKADSVWDTFGFVDRKVFFDNAEQAPYTEYTLLSDEDLLDAIANIGKATPKAVAVTCAFESYLQKKVAACWGGSEVSCLSVEFLIAFGRELTPRLDIHHRIRSTKLSPEELTLLSSVPFSFHINAETLHIFQLEYNCSS